MALKSHTEEQGVGDWICLDSGDLKFDAVKGFVECERGEKLMQRAIM